MDACAGNVVLGMMVCAVRVYAPLCIKEMTLSISAAAIASGRKPSKLMIRTRSILGGGVNVMVGRGASVGGAGVLLGVRVAVTGTGVIGGGESADDPHEDRKSTRMRVEIAIRLFISFANPEIFWMHRWGRQPKCFVNG